MGPFIKRLYVRLALAGRNRRRNMEACLNRAHRADRWIEASQ